MAKADAGLTYSQQLEARRIERSAGVVAGSLSFEAEGGGQLVAFDIETEPTVNLPAADIRAVERILFVYKDGRRFGETAPSHVLCERADFPRNIVHLCAGIPGCLAAPCLSIGGLQPIYERTGIEAVMGRLRDFLRDAKTGTLTADGWEPVPFGVDQKLRLGELIPWFFQEYAIAHLTDGHAVGVAVNLELEEGKYVAVYPEALPPAALMDGIAFRNKDSGKRRGIPWVFLWPPPDRIETEPIFADWLTGADLRSGMQRIGVDAAFDAVVGDLLAVQHLDFICERPPEWGKGLVVVLGVWRQDPIMPALFGYSENPDARRLELRAFMISQEWGKQIVADDAEVQTIVGDYPASPELFAWVSGVRPLPPVTLFGAGALGSSIYQNLARSGLRNAIVYDKDVMLPHNLARHTGTIEDLYRDKVAHLDRLSHGLARHSEVRVEAKKLDIAAIEIELLVNDSAGRLVIDATADERVRLRLDELRDASNVKIVRAEMFNEGRLGVTFVSTDGGPSLSDMMMMLIASAPHERAVAEWLEYEARHPLGPDPMLYGFGCTSQTIRLPNHVVALQAAAATSVILDDSDTSAIGLNPLDAQFRSTGWRWLAADPFQVLVPPTEKEWQVRLAPSAVERMKVERASALPNETGGYLYGGWDPVRRTITIVHASGLPPKSVASPTSLKLGPAGETAEELRLIQKTHGRLYLCGTWHSHPNGNASVSGRDYKTMMEHHAKDAETLSPTLIVIVADEDIQAHIKVPHG